MLGRTKGTGMATVRHDVVIIGGGSAGATMAARWHRAGVTDLAVIEPSATHYYQPLWTKAWPDARRGS
jgi:sulfide:quinone oxidoreductase